MASTKALERWSGLPRTTPSMCSLNVVARRLKGSNRLRRAHEDERQRANPAPRQPEPGRVAPGLGRLERADAADPRGRRCQPGLQRQGPAAALNASGCWLPAMGLFYNFSF